MGYKVKRGGYYRNGKYIRMDWGDKISKAQRTDEYRKKREINIKCKGCGKEIVGHINQKYCDLRCKYLSDTKDPIDKKAITLSSCIVFGPGKREFFKKLIEESIGEHCRYCGDMLTLETLSVDHIVPFGETSLRNNRLVKKILDKPDNLQIICKQCNSMKGNLSSDKFVKLLDFLDKDLELKNYVFKKMKQSNIMWSFKRKLNP